METRLSSSGQATFPRNKESVSMDGPFERLISHLRNYPTGELDFIGPEQGEDVLFVENNLAVPVTLIPSLLARAYGVLFYHPSSSSLSGGGVQEKDIDACTLVVACLNPECYSLWRYRKNLVKSGYLVAELEYRLSEFLLTKHASKGRIWEYRCWLLDSFPIPAFARANDGHVCSRAADKYKCNYPSWNFRRKYILHGKDSEVLLYELQENQVFVKRHVGDSSGWSYRQSIWLKCLLKSSEVAPSTVPISEKDCVDAFESELEWIRSFILFYPDHESAWLHYRFLVVCIASRKSSIASDLLSADQVAAVVSNSVQFGLHQLQQTGKKVEDDFSNSQAKARRNATRFLGYLVKQHEISTNVYVAEISSFLSNLDGLMKNWM